MKCFTLLCFLFFSALVNAAEIYDIIIVAGQSNAEGIGKGAYSDDFRLDHRISQLGRANQDNMKVIPATDQLQSVSYPANFIGFGMSFAREYARSFLPAGHKVLLIPAALSASSIIQWENSQPAFQDMKNRVNEILKTNPAHRVVAFLWHQSETDILFIENKAPGMNKPVLYQARLQNLLFDIRSNITANVLYPIIMGEPVPSWFKKKSSKCDVVRVIHQAAKTNPAVLFVAADGLKSNKEAGIDNDEIHFSAASQIIYGKKYFEVFRTRQSFVGNGNGCF